MSYADFSAKDLMQKFGVKFHSKHLFENVPPVQPSEWLETSLNKSLVLGFTNEKSRSERIVSPILIELSDINAYNFYIHSGANLDVDESLGLRRECDFMFSFSQVREFVMSPVFCITEAKKQDIEKGTIQCAAQLIGAKKLNEAEGNPVDTLYGCSTTGLEWRFIEYTDNQIIIDKTYRLINKLPELLGVLQHIVEVSKKQFPELVSAA